MTKNLWLVLGAMLSTSVLAQQVTNPPPAGLIESNAPAAAATTTTVAPAAATNAPATKAAKKKSASKKKAAEKSAPKKAVAGSELKSVPLVPGPAVVDASNVNVRGQAKLKSEIVTRVTKGQPVTVLEEITLKNSGPEEPSAWAKILLPTNSAVWVNKSFIDATAKTVVPRKLNVRSGPGENYSVLGQLLKGEAVKELDSKGEWLKIEAPSNAYAFVAAQYLKQETGPATAPTIAAAEPTPAPAEQAKVTEGPAVAAPPTETPAAANPPAEMAAGTNAPTELASGTNAPAELAGTSTNAPAEPKAEEPPPKRIVQREGIVRGTVSIQAPTYFALVSLDTHKLIDYLHTTSTELDLSRYKGLRIIVTGEEALEERWGNTPVLTIQKIEVP